MTEPQPQHKFKSHRINAGLYAARYRYYHIELSSPETGVWNGRYSKNGGTEFVPPTFKTKKALIEEISRSIDALIDGTKPKPTDPPTMDSIRNAILKDLERDYSVIRSSQISWGVHKTFPFNEVAIYEGRAIVFKDPIKDRYRVTDLDSGNTSVVPYYDSLKDCNYYLCKEWAPGAEPTKIIYVKEELTLDKIKFEDLTDTGGGGTVTVDDVPSPAPASTDPVMGPLIDALTAAVDPKIDEKLKVFDKKFENELIDAKDRLASELKKSVARLSKPTLVSFDRGDGSEPTPPKLAHKMLPTLLKVIESGVAPMIVGPAGGGKTTAAMQVAEMLKLPFYFSGAMSGLHQLNGFKDANGEYHETQTYSAFKNGGVLLLDELDAGHAEVLVGTNMLSENGMHDFPTGRVDKHKDFILIAGANTYGRGADRMYVGRNQLDAATLDRYAIVNWDYDEELERVLAGNDLITDEVQRLRKGCAKAKIRHVISPRASIFGARLYSKGFKLGEILDMVVFKGLDVEQIKKIKNAA